MRQTKALILLVFAISFFAGGSFADSSKEHVIRQGDTPASVAKRFGVTVDELLRFNQMSPGGPFRVGAKLKIPRPGEVTGAAYTVRQGDSLAGIADFHGVSQDDLRTANGLKKTEVVKPGQKLAIPHGLRSGASRGHVVRKGDTLASIAKSNGVSTKSLAAANKLATNTPLELGRTLVIPDDDSDADPVYRRKQESKLQKTGEKVPGGVLHTVQPGQSLWIIARAYNTSGAKIAQANGFEETTPLKEGDKVLIPKAKFVAPVRVKGFTIPSVRFVSVWNNESATLKLITKSGKVNQKSRVILSKLSGPRGKSARTKLLHPRLIHMLERVAERYPGHTIELVSGYRPRKPGTILSKHNVGRAMDFRVQGVDRKELYEYIKTLPNVGAGYYPISVFVHMDVRDKPSLWTDYSGVGEDADYRGKDADPEALADAEGGE